MNESEECFGAEISGVKMKRNNPMTGYLKLCIKYYNSFNF